MLNVELKNLRALKEEVCRLEGIGGQMEKCRDFEKKKEYCKDLEWCRKERRRLISENPLKEVPLSKREMVMAEKFYYEGKTWEKAFYDMVDTLAPLKQEEYLNNEERYREKMKKSIMRKIQKYSNYYK